MILREYNFFGKIVYFSYKLILIATQTLDVIPAYIVYLQASDINVSDTTQNQQYQQSLLSP